MENSIVTKELKITQIEDEIPKETPDKLLSQFKQRHKKLSKNKLFQWFMKFSWFRKLMFKTILKKKGSSHKFPDWIIKTDETRIQNMPWVISDYAGKPMVVTEKIDGTSTTFGLRKEKKRKEKNSWFALAMFGKQHRLKSVSTTTMSTIS